VVACAKVGMKDNEAHHVMFTSRAGCEVLLTMDGGLLLRAKMIEQQIGLLVAELAVLCIKMGQ
jgi:hypothetical protein